LLAVPALPGQLRHPRDRFDDRPFPSQLLGHQCQGTLVPVGEEQFTASGCDGEPGRAETDPARGTGDDGAHRPGPQPTLPRPLTTAFAITVRRMSLVPSPILISMESRNTRSISTSFE
jgi:hypothetical protein